MPLGLGFITLVTSFETLFWAPVLLVIFHTEWFIIPHQLPSEQELQKDGVQGHPARAPEPVLDDFLEHTPQSSREAHRLRSARCEVTLSS